MINQQTMTAPTTVSQNRFKGNHQLTKPTETRLKMSYEAFLEWADEDTHAEWVNGEVIVFMAAKDIHQTVVFFLAQLLNLYVNLFDLGKVQLAPFEMKLSPDGSSREPDVLFVAKENLARLTADRLNGPADLIVEIISTDSVKRDRSDKFKEYRQAGVKEYWLIDPRPGKQRADFYLLDEQGQYDLIATEETERVASTVLAGFWLKPAWLWQAGSLNPLTLFLQHICQIPNDQVEQLQQTARANLQPSLTPNPQEENQPTRRPTNE